MVQVKLCIAGPYADQTNLKPKVTYYQNSTGTDLYARHLGWDGNGRWSIEDIIPPNRNFTWGVYDKNTNNAFRLFEGSVTKKIAKVK